MGKIKNLATGIMEMAEQLGDPYGFELETVDYIAGEFQISTQEVQAVFDLMTSEEKTYG
jgi:hypothetical protein